MANLSLKHMYKIYDGDVTAVKDFNLEIEDKEFVVFVGPSGCGKSTILRMIAGLEEITKGELYIDGELENNVPPKNRDIAMVFQNYALYPHMTVYDNMAFGLKLRKIPKKDIAAKVKEAAQILDIEHLLDRKPKALSGGQRQRVAMGRAIVRAPKVFLMDEPLSNLDAKLRVQMRSEISKLYNRLQTTFVYVTHDQTEAMTLGTKIVVMKDGIIQQIDTPQNLYEHPKNIFVAGFIGSPQMNFINSKIIEQDGKVVVNFEDSIIPLTPENSAIIRKQGYIGKDIIIGIRPENINDDPEFIEKNKEAIIDVKVEITELLGAESYLHLSKGNSLLTARVNGTSKTKSGDCIKIALNINKLHIFDKDSQKPII